MALSRTANMSISYRSGKPEDAEGAVALWREVEAELVKTGQHPPGDEAEAVAMIGGVFRDLPHHEVAHYAQVVLVDGVLRGFGFVFNGHLYFLYVGQEIRGRRQGTKLLDALKARHGDRITLNVWASNSLAVRFYAREGFRETTPESADPIIPKGQLRMTWLRAA